MHLLLLLLLHIVTFHFDFYDSGMGLRGKNLHAITITIIHCTTQTAESSIMLWKQCGESSNVNDPIARSLCLSKNWIEFAIWAWDDHKISHFRAFYDVRSRHKSEAMLSNLMYFLFTKSPERDLWRKCQKYQILLLRKFQSSQTGHWIWTTLVTRLGCCSHRWFNFKANDSSSDVMWGQGCHP